jgi:hypothetical protein
MVLASALHSEHKKLEKKMIESEGAKCFPGTLTGISVIAHLPPALGVRVASQCSIVKILTFVLFKCAKGDIASLLHYY